MSYAELQYKSTALQKAVTLQIFLPGHEGFGENRPYKTLYFLHGITGNAKELIQFLNFRSQTLLKGIAVVFCDGDNSLYADRGDGYNNYRKFVEEEIVKVTRETFPLSDRREDTFVGGISMGGHGALITGLTRSDVFSKIAVLSPAINFYDIADMDGSPIPYKFLDGIYGSREVYESSDVSCMTRLEKSISEGMEIPKIYMAWGNQDPLVLEQDRKFADILKKKGASVESLETDGAHDIFLWDRLLDGMFDFLLKR